MAGGAVTLTLAVSSPGTLAARELAQPASLAPLTETDLRAQAVPVAETPAHAGEAFDGPTLQLTAGRQRLLQPGHAVGRIAVGDPNVLDVKVLRAAPSGNGSAAGNPGGPAAELLLTARTPGSTTLVVWPARAGSLPQSWQVQVRAQQLILERQLASVPQHAQALAELRLAAPPETALLDRSQIEVRSNTVQVDVQVVEFKKSALKEAGINIFSGGRNNHGFSFGVFQPGTNTTGSFSTGNASAGIGANGTSNQYSGSGQISASVVSAMNLVLGFGKAFNGAGIGVQMGFLEGNGLARVLARPTLLAHSGQSASFLAGGEIPVPVPSNDGNIAIEYKEFGVKLQLTPTILSNQRIALKVAPEASDLDFSSGVAVGGVSVPAIRTRRADTMVELGDGESFVIGGLVSRSTSSYVDKVPVLGDLPVLGAFFKNMSYSQEETELAIVVTPSLVHPLPAGTDFERLLPGATSERPNASQVWEPFVAGALKPDAALPGFSY
ncbi:type II and III secretion system protein family protein [Corticibacter populi]|uniref:Type II and III secretion system protein family protein n=2 Tax=Corticibacter populi TaxID=1550736 RepID=A0A3M6QTJ8_9BURK|nr:type II and III secretion system protein family protein [Corticibacter populi]